MCNSNLVESSSQEICHGALDYHCTKDSIWFVLSIQVEQLPSISKHTFTASKRFRESWRCFRDSGNDGVTKMRLVKAIACSIAMHSSYVMLCRSNQLWSKGWSPRQAQQASLADCRSSGFVKRLDARRVRRSSTIITVICWPPGLI